MAKLLIFMNIFHLAYTNHCYYLHLHKIDEVYYMSKNVAGTLFPINSTSQAP